MDAKLPTSWYFDTRIFELEQRKLFDTGYVAHEHMVPQPGDYQSIEWLDDAKVLVHGPTGVELIDNVCRHRQALLMTGRGSARSLVCPAHRWTYGLDGTLKGAPHFSSNPCKHLAQTPLSRWNGLLFTGPTQIAEDLAQWGAGSPFDMANYTFDRAIVAECQQNWKTFIEVYLDLYHVAPAHPGLGNFVSCVDPQWEIGPRHSVQKVGIRDLQRPGTPIWAEYHDQVKAKVPNRPNGALWLLYYPNLMLEWYPGALMISTVIPKSPTRTLNVVEFYYPQGTDRAFIEAQQAAYLETAKEDEDLGNRIDRGRAVVLRRGVEDLGPIHSPLEDGIPAFHDYLFQQLGAP